MKKQRRTWTVSVSAAICFLWLAAPCHGGVELNNGRLLVRLRPQEGVYEIAPVGATNPVLVSRVAAQINHRWITSAVFRWYRVEESPFETVLGKGKQIEAAFSGLANNPDLICRLRLYDSLPFGEVRVTIRNNTQRNITVQAIRSVDAIGKPLVNLGGAASADRVLSDSFSEERPLVHIYDLGRAPVYLGLDKTGVELSDTHLAVGSQLIYNRDSGQSLLLGALTAQRWLTLCHLRVDRQDTNISQNIQIASYTIDSTGTTEIQKRDRLRFSSREDQIELSLPVSHQSTLDSEPLLFAAGLDYHAQLEAYGDAVRQWNHGRSAPAPAGWWSYTVSFHGGMNEGSMLTNAEWLDQHLKNIGYDYFFLDAGYHYADGEYTAADANKFPRGMRPVGHEVSHMGLNFGVWTAPFWTERRAWIYQHHKDWLVRNAQGKPIRIYGAPNTEPLFIVDTTNPGAQKYMVDTYREMVREWGVRLIKLDFMDDTAVEGFYYRPHTTALEAYRIGLSTIRKAVGEDVLLDKDGGPLLPAVGIVDEGRISSDTQHSFEGRNAIRGQSSGLAARYYMNRKFFVNDPDAFVVSKQPGIDDSERSLTLGEAEVSIVQSAMAGGMYEIGDDLPSLASDPERLALVENRELLRIVKLGRAAIPVDLMTYLPEDEQPSISLLREDRRQAMIAIFNWTTHSRSRTVNLAELGFPAEGRYEAFDVLQQEMPVPTDHGSLRFKDQPPHSVRLIKVINSLVSPAAPEVSIHGSTKAEAGMPVDLSAVTTGKGVPALDFEWDFGDGTRMKGEHVTHVYTMPGAFTARLRVEGVDGIPAELSLPIVINGNLGYVRPAPPKHYEEKLVEP